MINLAFLLWSHWLCPQAFAHDLIPTITYLSWAKFTMLPKSHRCCKYSKEVQDPHLPHPLALNFNVHRAQFIFLLSVSVTWDPVMFRPSVSLLLTLKPKPFVPQTTYFKWHTPLHKSPRLGKVIYISCFFHMRCYYSLLRHKLTLSTLIMYRARCSKEIFFLKILRNKTCFCMALSKRSFTHSQLYINRILQTSFKTRWAS